MRSWTTEFHDFPTIDSTNEWCKLHAFPKNSREVIIARADTQTKGRGQHGRTWLSPPGCNLYLTYCFLLPDLEQVMHIPQVLCLSLLHVLQGYDINPHVKWPNDVYVEGKKIAGVLCEVYDKRCVIGIGVNVNMTQEWLDAVPQPATSIAVLRKKTAAVDEVMYSLTERFLEDLSLLLDKGFSVFYSDYLSYLLYLNQIVRWTYGEETLIGRVKGIDPKGRIILFLEDKEIEVILQSGQIRPYETYNS